MYLNFIAGLVFLFSLNTTEAYFRSNTSLPILEISDLPDYPIGSYIQFLKVQEELEIHEIIQKLQEGQFQALENTHVLNKGFGLEYWWVAFRVKNIQQKANTVIFSPAGPSIRKGVLYSLDEMENILAFDFVGIQTPPKNRVIESRINSLELHFNAGEEKLFLFLMDTRGLSTFVPFYLDDVKSYWEYEVGRSLGFGLVGGVLLMAMVLGLFLLIYLKEKIYGCFTLFVFASLLLILEEDGFAYWFIYGNLFPSLAEILIPLLCLLITLFFMEFVRLFFIQPKKESLLPSLGKVLTVVSILVGSLLFFNLFDHSYFKLEIIFIITAFVIAFSNLSVSISILASYLRENRSSVYFLLVASLILVLGLVNYLLNHLGLTTFNLFYPNGIVFGTLFMVIVLSLSVINRYYSLKNQKELLAKELLLKEQTKMAEIFAALESERNRIGRDLHDDLGALLSITKLKMDEIKSSLNGTKSQVAASFDEVDRLLQAACQDVRFISHELMPQDIQEKRLATLVAEIIDALQNQETLNIQYDIGELPLISSGLKLHVFRIIKELINNIIRHSKATHADVNLFYDPEEEVLNLLIWDDGVGFDKAVVLSSNSGLGLISIQKRIVHLNGEISIDSGDNGTQICVSLPLKMSR
ncbi:MAG: 7TM diverse intracellular signaling domain-containing protein [Mongoliitalea sp.]